MFNVDSVNDIRNWGFRDPAPSAHLDDLQPLSKRAHALIARNASKPILQTNFLQLVGAISMMKGLDYHYQRYMRLIEEFAAGDQADEEALIHEAVAYVNRAGQFYYFVESDLVKLAIGRLATPKLDAILIFRHKHSAHRSIDKPRGETDHQRAVQAMALSEIGGTLWYPKPGTVGPPTPPLWGTHYCVYQLNTGDQVFELVVERDHPVIMGETYGVIEKLLA